MIGDILTVALKEWKEYLAGSGLRGGRAGLVVVLIVFGVMLPLQRGIEWLGSPMLIVAWAWVPLMLVVGVVADSFAGERERHTLETLLASRLSDRTILLGKVAAAVGYGWGSTMVMAAASIVSVNAAHWKGRVAFLPLMTAVGAPVFSFLTAMAAACAGVLVSLRAPTARQAAQMLSIAVMLLLFVPIYGVQALPSEVRTTLAAALVMLDPRLGFAALAVLLAVLDVVLLFFGFARFRRASLILD